MGLKKYFSRAKEPTFLQSVLYCLANSAIILFSGKFIADKFKDYPTLQTSIYVASYITSFLSACAAISIINRKIKEKRERRIKKRETALGINQLEELANSLMENETDEQNNYRHDTSGYDGWLYHKEQ